MRRRAFTLVEVIVALALSAILLGVVVMVARHFLFGFLWGEETFVIAHEAAFAAGFLRRDLARTDLAADGALAVRIEPGRIAITTPGAAAPTEYRFEPERGMIFRTVPGAAPQGFGQGLVTAFAVSPVWLVQRAGRVVPVAALAAGEAPYRSGIRVELSLRGQDLAGAGGPVRTFAFATHVFPVFANHRAASIWNRR